MQHSPLAVWASLCLYSYSTPVYITNGLGIAPSKLNAFTDTRQLSCSLRDPSIMFAKETIIMVTYLDMHGFRLWGFRSWGIAVFRSDNYKVQISDLLTLTTLGFGA